MLLGDACRPLQPGAGHSGVTQPGPAAALSLSSLSRRLLQASTHLPRGTSCWVSAWAEWRKQAQTWDPGAEVAPLCLLQPEPAALLASSPQATPHPQPDPHHALSMCLSPNAQLPLARQRTSLPLSPEPFLLHSLCGRASAALRLRSLWRSLRQSAGFLRRALVPWAGCACADSI